MMDTPERLLREIVEAYTAYRNKGVLPAPDHYQRMVGAIIKAQVFLAQPPSAEYVLVPVEPTTEMLLAGEKAGAHRQGAAVGVFLRDCYKAMLSAHKAAKENKGD